MSSTIDAVGDLIVLGVGLNMMKKSGIMDMSDNRPRKRKSKKKEDSFLNW